MTKLSVNINKIATIRNARGGNIPDLIKAARLCEDFGAEGITLHPRPDERHVRYQDVRDIKKVIKTELNIEGYPSERFLSLIEEVKPEQVTLVPDGPDALTSNSGWNTIEHRNYLSDIVDRINKVCRVSIFVDPIPEMIIGAKECGAQRVELYTESYAKNYPIHKKRAIYPFIIAAQTAQECLLGLNAGHDLSLENLEYFQKKIPNLLEVSIGHALISDSLYYGLENTIQLYKRLLN
ncbi:MAG: pyridoxine 5'-phosphate synthase [Bacteroidales bacterium]|jgi:pyridoxine 5-phosphate synthase|nr:pyridoxine 5'-phosphate synthase [Bacteroidales bacterium]